MDVDGIPIEIEYFQHSSLIWILGSTEASSSIYKALPVDVRKTLQKQVDTLPNPLNPKDGPNFLTKFINERTTGEMADITQEIKKVFSRIMALIWGVTD